MHITRKLTPLAAIALALAACSSSSATPTTGVTPAPTDSQTLTITYAENAQIELAAPGEPRIYIDIWDATSLAVEPTSSDILLITHLHGDHYQEAFTRTFPGTKLVNETRDLTVGDIKIKSIAAAHTDAAIVAEDPDNHIFVIEYAGFKIVHMGSTGQLELTAEQLAAIGSDVDIAVGGLVNVGGNDPDATKQIDIINQVNPKLVIPTHSVLAYIQAAGAEWQSTWSSKPTVTIPHSELPARTTLLCMGNIATSYGAILNVPESSW
jgi:L-ascorbate metabolism protein UlaG (beta-lactamase superfamily)